MAACPLLLAGTRASDEEGDNPVARCEVAVCDSASAPSLAVVICTPWSCVVLVRWHPRCLLPEPNLGRQAGVFHSSAQWAGVARVTDS